MFNKEDYYILGGSWEQKKNIWNKDGNLICPIEKSQLNEGGFIETTYIDNKPYILLSGNRNFAKVYAGFNRASCREMPCAMCRVPLIVDADFFQGRLNHFAD